MLYAGHAKLVVERLVAWTQCNWVLHDSLFHVRINIYRFHSVQRPSSNLWVAERIQKNALKIVEESCADANVIF